MFILTYEDKYRKTSAGETETKKKINNFELLFRKQVSHSLTLLTLSLSLSRFLTCSHTRAHSLSDTEGQKSEVSGTLRGRILATANLAHFEFAKTHSLLLSLSLMHTHSHTHTRTLARTCTYKRFQSICLCLFFSSSFRPLK